MNQFSITSTIANCELVLSAAEVLRIANCSCAVPMIRTLQQGGATREDIIAFIKRAKSKKTSPKLDVCKNFDNTKLKPVLPDNAPIAIVLFAGGGGIEAGMVEAGIRPVIAVEHDTSKPELSRAREQLDFVRC